MAFRCDYSTVPIACFVHSHATAGAFEASIDILDAAGPGWETALDRLRSGGEAATAPDGRSRSASSAPATPGKSNPS